jgi:hypothetical protein
MPSIHYSPLTATAVDIHRAGLLCSKGSAFTVRGTITLELKMVFGSTSDKILLGGLSLLT